MKKNTIWSGYYKRKKRYWFTACILLSLVILLACIMMVYGNTIYMPGTVLEPIGPGVCVQILDPEQCLGN